MRNRVKLVLAGSLGAVGLASVSCEEEPGGPPAVAPGERPVRDATEGGRRMGREVNDAVGGSGREATVPRQPGEGRSAR